MHPLDRRTVAAGLGFIAMAAILIWFWARADRPEGFGMTACAQLYRDAASLADTIRADGQTPQPEKGEPNALTCGALRASYPDKVVPPTQ